MTQTDFADGTSGDPDAIVRKGVRHRVFLLTALGSQRQITVGALTFAELHDLRHFFSQPTLAALAHWIHRNQSNSSTMGSLHTRPSTQD